MGLFRRSAVDALPDDALPFLTVDEAAEVRRLAADAFASAGVEVVVHPDHLQDGDGRQFGLWNVAAACKAAGPRRRWRRVVRGHVATLVDLPPNPADLPVEEVLAAAVLRVHAVDQMPPPMRDSLTYGRHVADGLVELVVHDSPKSTMVLLDEDVERCGADALRAAGLEHLLAEPFTQDVLTAAGGARIDVLEGESVFVASKVLVLPHVLDRVHGRRHFPDGVLVALPDRHHLLLHPVTSGDVVPALQAMAGLTADAYAKAAGGLSPSVYWWQEGRMTRLSVVGPDGVRIEVQDAFAEVLERLAATR
ncbi:hypothetical protein ICW40_01575 [Actinotalea ferrariae]|uniref:hypothetical protein n=1 Tax=Actinotalea ferrariae TaxID=1386098 RepID=UPI001C8C2B68|nr:hypothetical protein [Actinotalea ferrariae]MBX9243494.1 hypothetical protein [Actinotalea ferrariae]